MAEALRIILRVSVPLSESDDVSAAAVGLLGCWGTYDVKPQGAESYLLSDLGQPI